MGALITLVLWIFPKVRRTIAPVVALTTIAISIYPVVFGSYLHHIDFVAETMDGTKASPPYWKELGVLWLPILVASAFLICPAVFQKTRIARK